ncbi:universal stress protein [Actinomadura luteofluorescens]|uniref:universal stress protein n=1 Tax=Actinomadura luteofluorescens TaxID=46163 RepID=UPI0036384BD8
MIGEHVLAGYVPDAGGREALDLARGIVALTGGRLSVATVHPPDLPAAAARPAHCWTRWPTSWRGAADLLVQEGRSVGRGLTVLASRIGADLIVVGSPEGGARGRIGVGAAADHLLHSATEAVMLAPSGHRSPDELGRITVMYVRRPQCDEAVIRSAQAAERLEVPLRLVTLAIGDVNPEPLRDDLALAIRLALDSADLLPEDVSAEVAEGDDVADALEDVDWPEGELLVCASSEDAAAHRVFLGEVALKVLRAAPARSPSSREATTE